MKIVLLGANGFIGSAIVRNVAKHPNLSLKALVRRQNSPDTVLPNISWVRGSLRRLPQNLFPKEPFILLHFANKQIDRDKTGFECNFSETKMLLNQLPPWCRAIFYGSSMSVYGSKEQVHISEKTQCRPETKLAESRRNVEKLIEHHARLNNLWSVNLRPRFVIGTMDRSVMPAMVYFVRKGLAPGTGKQLFSIIDVDDYACIILKLAAQKINSRPPQQIALNIAYRMPVAMQSIEQMIATHIGPSPFLIRLPVNQRVNALLQRLIPPSSGLVEKLQLVGLSHTMDTNQLHRLIGGGLIDQNPMLKVKKALMDLL